MSVPSRRLGWLMLAGILDSFSLSFAWTVVMIHMVSAYGLGAAGIVSASMLVGVALSAPVASRLALHLDGRRLLRCSAGVESLLRVLVLVLLVQHAPTVLLATCVTAMNVTAWTGYAGMRAEVAAVSPGSTALTWYATGVATVEAVAAAAGALFSVAVDTSSVRVLAIVGVVYVAGLVPTYLIAHGSHVPRAVRDVDERPRRSARMSLPVVAGALLMLAASAPTLLSVGLATQVHGRSSVAVVAVAFTVGSLASPLLSGWSQRRRVNGPTLWALCAAGMVAGWAVAPVSVVLMAVAQAASGLFMTSLEGLLDAETVARAGRGVTGALARGSAARALGSAGGTALLPAMVAGVGLTSTSVVLTCLLLTVAAGVRVDAARWLRPGPVWRVDPAGPG